MNRETATINACASPVEGKALDAGYQHPSAIRKTTRRGYIQESPDACFPQQTLVVHQLRTQAKPFHPFPGLFDAAFELAE